MVAGARHLCCGGVTTPPPDTPAGLLAAARAGDPSRPFLTFYDDGTGERVELSLATLDNWVAKTANLLQDGLGTAGGERVAILLPPHWQSAVWMLAAWSAGLVVDLRDASDAIDAGGGSDDPNGADAPASTGADVVVAGADQLERALAAGGRDTVALALRPLGGPFTEPLPAGVLDYGAEVLAYGDAFVPYTPPDGNAPALLTTADPTAAAGPALTGAALVRRAQALATTLALEPGARLLTDANPAGPDGCFEALLAPLAAQSSIVLVRHPDRSLVERRVAEEKVTRTRLRTPAEPGDTP